MALKDSGARRQFETGAVRDIAAGKGRCDLLPLEIVGDLINSNVLIGIEDYIRSGDIVSLYNAINDFVTKDSNWPDIFTAMLEVSKQYEEGAQKYSERNWEKGIPLHCYIDSAVRHYLKFKRGDEDEPHDRAFVWNLLGAAWTHINKPEMIDLPFIDERKGEEDSNEQ